MRSIRLGISLLFGFLSFAVLADARPIYVDNQNGSDSSDGLTPEFQSQVTGPLATLRRALKIARQGDNIVLRKSEFPYAESLFLAGTRHSGYDQQFFTIEGNGATLTGRAPLPRDGWQQQADGLWRLSLTRKGYYRFFRAGEPLSEHVLTSTPWKAEDIPVDHWTSSRGAVYFHLDDQRSPLAEDWTYAAGEIGVSLVDVANVHIKNLTVDGFRIDGINADSSCRNIVLENVTLSNNGRAGLAVGGTSQVSLITSQIHLNGRHSVLISERGGLTIDQSDLSGVEPTVQPLPSR